jgi:hypothetical protein
MICAGPPAPLVTTPSSTDTQLRPADVLRTEAGVPSCVVQELLAQIA